MGHMDEFDQIEAEYMERHPERAPRSMQQVVYPEMLPGQPMQLYPLALAQSPALSQVAPAEEAVGMLQRKFVGIPVWGWGLAVAGAGVGWYFFGREKPVKPNGASSDDREEEESAPSSGGPSRSRFGEKLRTVLAKNGIADKSKIYIDADDAQKHLKGQVSPLVSVQCKVANVPMKELDKLARREGLSAVEHSNGVVGFYPGGGKKGKAWEEYIDALRQEGQEV